MDDFGLKGSALSYFWGKKSAKTHRLAERRAFVSREAPVVGVPTKPKSAFDSVVFAAKNAKCRKGFENANLQTLNRSIVSHPMDASREVYEILVILTKHFAVFAAKSVLVKFNGRI